MRSIVMHKSKGFTLIELLVVIAVIALLMAILMPALQRSRKQAKTVVCQANLRQLGTVAKLWTDDHDGLFSKWQDGWPYEWAEHYVDKKLILCPSAFKPDVPRDRWGKQQASRADCNGGRNHPWITRQPLLTGETFIGSYGLNQWVTRHYGSERSAEKNWKTPYVKGASYVPLLLDSARHALTPLPYDQPPEYDGQVFYHIPGDIDEIRSYSLNRHNYSVNGVFLDFHVERIGLKRLWKLK